MGWRRTAPPELRFGSRGGPTLAWNRWSQEAVRRGLSPRSEATVHGLDVPGLADALRVFEIHPGQCGVLVYVADALAAAFVVPHPDDYRALHPTLLQDRYGELIHQYGYFGGSVPDFEANLGDGQHIGELITDHKGRTAYPKTFRLAPAQIRRRSGAVRRGHLLNSLADNDWHLRRTADQLGTTSEEIVRRIRAAGFGTPPR